MGGSSPTGPFNPPGTDLTLQLGLVLLHLLHTHALQSLTLARVVCLQLALQLCQICLVLQVQLVHKSLARGLQLIAGLF